MVKPINPSHLSSDVSYSLPARGWRAGRLVFPHAASAFRVASDERLQFGQNTSRSPGGVPSYMMMTCRRFRRTSYTRLMTRQTILCGSMIILIFGTCIDDLTRNAYDLTSILRRAWVSPDMIRLLGEIDGKVNHFYARFTPRFEWVVCRTRPGYARDEFEEAEMEVRGHESGMSTFIQVSPLRDRRWSQFLIAFVFTGGP